MMLARDTRRYIAIDPDREAVAKARQQSGNAQFFIGSGENMPLGDSSFDRVIFILSLHHQNSRQALLEAHRVLAPGGRVIILEPSAKGEFQQFFHLFDDETAALTYSPTNFAPESSANLKILAFLYGQPLDNPDCYRWMEFPYKTFWL
jgi:ubiquinone/menaquinone biosynthesis C-methylase UbiE